MVHEIGYYYFFLKRKDHVELSIPEKHKIRNHGCKQKTSKEMTWGEVGGEEITIIYSMIFFQKKKTQNKKQLTPNNCKFGLHSKDREFCIKIS